MAITELEIDGGCYRGNIASFKKSDSLYPTLIMSGTTNIITWGENRNAQCGVSDFEGAPIQMDTAAILDITAGASSYDNGGTGFIQRACDANFTMLYSTLYLFLYGTNTYNQISSDGSSPAFIEYQPGFHEINACCVGHHAACVIGTGSLFVWGRNQYNQCGSGGSTVNFGENEIEGPFKSVACGRDFTLAILQDGTLWGMGRNDRGQLGSAEPAQIESFTQIGESAIWEEVACGADHSLLLDYIGRLWAAGANDMGQLGLSHYNDVTEFTPIGQDIWNCIGAGYKFSLGVSTTGLKGWGSNSHGQLGIGSTGGNEHTPRDCVITPVYPNDATKVIYKIGCGLYHSAVITINTNYDDGPGGDADGYPCMTTGDDTFGQLGNEVKGVNRNTFRAASGLSDTVETSMEYKEYFFDVDCGDYHTIVSRGNFALLPVLATGANAYGQCDYYHTSYGSDTDGNWTFTQHGGAEWFNICAGQQFTGCTCTSGT